VQVGARKVMTQAEVNQSNPADVSSFAWTNSSADTSAHVTIHVR
jgi:hypothetical protein